MKKLELIVLMIEKNPILQYNQAAVVSFWPNTLIEKNPILQYNQAEKRARARR